MFSLAESIWEEAEIIFQKGTTQSKLIVVFLKGPFPQWHSQDCWPRIVKTVNIN